MNHQTVINLYYFIRKSHEEPSRFIKDDFDTVKEQLMLMKQYGLPGTYALKHDALIDERYLALLSEYLDEGDEIGVWWEITEELCRRAGVCFRGKQSDVHDNRVNSAYSLGYLPQERRALVDAYMKDYHDRFHCYPNSIGSWVIDITTLTYAHETYGVSAAALCRDQMATDGFTLWGGYPNGAYYPSRQNEYLPAQTKQGQLSMPVFRLLGPDPIRSYEEGVRPGLMGVYTLEPSCTEGRNPAFINWMFQRLANEDTLGMAYAQVGQENNFLWENMQAGLAIQVTLIHTLLQEGTLRVETMAQTASWFHAKYALTPPMTYNASLDYQEGSTLKTMWYACRNYRISVIADGDELFIRDWFVYRENYASRYLHDIMTSSDSLFDALPLMFPQRWNQGYERAKVSLLDENGAPLRFLQTTFTKEGEDTGILHAITKTGALRILFKEDGLTVLGNCFLHFNRLPALLKQEKNRLLLTHENFSYSINITRGTVTKGLTIQPEDSVISIQLTESDSPEQRNFKKNDFLTEAFRTDPAAADAAYFASCQGISSGRNVYVCPPPVILPGSCVCEKGTSRMITIKNPLSQGTIYVTTDGSQPDCNSSVYQEELCVTKDTIVQAILCTELGGNMIASAVASAAIFFTRKIARIESSTEFDKRKVFNKNGAQGLLKTMRGSTDYQDGNWLGNLGELDITVYPESKGFIKEALLGSISHHRVGILHPHIIKLWAADENGIMQELPSVILPDGPCSREIEKKDLVLPIGCITSAIRIKAIPYDVFPKWCCYKGMSWVFTMTDTIILR